MMLEQKKLIKIDSFSLAGLEYPKMFQCQRDNIDCIASLTANTILYNLSFLPQEVLDDPFTREVVAASIYLYPRYRFTTASNYWEEVTPERTLDIDDAFLVADLVCAILRSKGLEFVVPTNEGIDLPYFTPWKKGVFLDNITGTIVYV